MKQLQQMDTLKQSILKTLAYFDIFNHPLNATEIRTFMDASCNEQQLSAALNALIKENVIFKTSEFYQLQHDDSIAAARIQANTEAVIQLRNAKKIARLLSWFPFIKGVAVSGSLSKHIATEKSDYDFFIITAKNRLWICRTIFTAFCKFVSLFGFKKYFCLNYVIDETYLEVEEKNIFTATEIATLMPMYGNTLFANFFATNNWIYQYFPNMYFVKHPLNDRKEPVLKRASEWLMRNNMADKTDDSIMHFFQRRWKKMMQKHIYTETGYQLGAMMVNKHYCRHYPQHFQRHILVQHEERVAKLTSALLQYCPVKD